ncbi:Arginine--tRNA ligase [Bienertia sinuspersici]
MHPLDKEALLRTHTTTVDGNVVTFRGCDWYTVPSHLYFTTMRFWVRISGLPFGYLDPQWAQNILGHVGFVETVQGFPHALPPNQEFRALVWLDVTDPLILGFSCHFLIIVASGSVFVMKVFSASVKLVAKLVMLWRVASISSYYLYTYQKPNEISGK